MVRFGQILLSNVRRYGLQRLVSLVGPVSRSCSLTKAKADPVTLNPRHINPLISFLQKQRKQDARWIPVEQR
jgi:hypothetical protein